MYIPNTNINRISKHREHVQINLNNDRFNFYALVIILYFFLKKLIKTYKYIMYITIGFFFRFFIK